MSFLSISIPVALGLYLLHHAIVAGVLVRVKWTSRVARRVAEAELPAISIWVAARNEESNIIACMASLAALDYPTAKLQILLGDDRSSDATGELMQAFIADKPQFQYVAIPDNYPGQYGKQNVLAHLAHLAKGDLFLVTDADIVVKPGWARELVAGFTGPETGMVIGPTVVEGRWVGANLQGIDWLYGISTFRAMAELGLPVTAVGNNMAITRAAYEAVGRYEHLPFSITEDYILFAAVKGKGYRISWPFYAEVLNISRPVTGFRAYLNQRRRWFRGGREAPWYALEVLALQFICLPFIVTGLFWLPAGWALGLLGAKLAADLSVLGMGAGCLRSWRWLPYFFLHQVYFTLCIVLLPFYLLLPHTIDWKGRKF